MSSQTGGNVLLRLDLNNGGSGTNNQCDGTGDIDASGSGNLKQSLQVTSTTFSDYTINYNTLSAAEAYLMVAAVPPANSVYQTILIRKYYKYRNTAIFYYFRKPSLFSLRRQSPTTFTINTQGATGITGYTWNLGSSSNNRLYNGNPAPQSISTGINTLQLTPACNKTPSALSATVTLNGSSVNTTNNSTISYYQPSMSINGKQNICSGSANYIINNLPCLANVTWSLTPSSGVLNPSCLKCNQTTLTKQAAGSVTLKATVTNACGLTIAPMTLPIFTETNTVITGNYLMAINGNTIDQGALDNSGYPKTEHVPSTESVQYGITLTNTGLTGVSWNVSGACSNISSTPTSFYCLIPPPGGGASGITVNLRATGPCGTPINNNYSVAIYPNSYMMVSPNPATNSVKVVLQDKAKQQDNRAENSKNMAHQGGITAIKIYDLTGNLKKVQQGNHTGQQTVNVTGLHAGIYLIEVSAGTYKERQQLIIQQ